ncbi:UDP-N-acetylglucosamine--LPS N-acetylglucosamine transferase (plasmid) [Lactiplantibacillus plantarum]|uniref:PssD/Cps14F family polysaccharide biosynthesis glycosyltransferase n=1 Tax=Lactiplantibacillus plantarum TaxID=1590 RepID=UPI001F344560|nr:PssD/Cps14F family polysaccharide biosynthesis glycosyltransferase [Lactiplantibacillus plantarum]UJL26357.1 UDP-N-acetylglucosamine--LPS N-acetylglucosamine transferase [Lactiplantibacillus plantarum]
MKKICLVGSSGGHLTHLELLKPFWKQYDRFWVTFPKEDAKSYLKDEKMYSCYYPTNRNLHNLVRNTVLAFKIIKKERPDIIISSGAAVAVPFFYIGKSFGAKTIYVEVFDRVDAPTLTGKLVYPITDLFIVQWESMKKIYPKAKNFGGIF